MDKRELELLIRLQPFFMRLLAIEESQHKSDHLHGQPWRYMERDSFLQREKEEGGTQ
jgi:hypothetical protein